MPQKDTTSVKPDELLRQADALGAQAAEAIDQLLAQRRAVLESAQTRVAQLEAQIERLNELYKTANNRYYIPPLSEEKAPETSGARRTKPELEQMAKAIVEFVQSKGEAGVSGREIKAQFPGLTMSVKKLVQQYAGIALRDNGGVKAAMRYLPPAP